MSQAEAPTHHNTTPKDATAAPGEIIELSGLEIQRRKSSEKHVLPTQHAHGFDEQTEEQSSRAIATKTIHSVPICCDKLFWIRISVLMLSVFLFILSTAYALAQVVETKLDVVTRCPEPKTREQIWRHSYESAVRDGNGDVVMSEESMFGFTDDSCWTTRALTIDTELTSVLING